MKDDRKDTAAPGVSQREASGVDPTAGGDEMLEGRRIAQSQAAILQLLANAIVARINQQGRENAEKSEA